MRMKTNYFDSVLHLSSIPHTLSLSLFNCLIDSCRDILGPLITFSTSSTMLLRLNDY